MYRSIVLSLFIVLLNFALTANESTAQTDPPLQESPQHQTSQNRANQTRPVFALAGDSTVTDHAGWGRGFKTILRDHATCINFAKGGRSSRSFRTEGFWDQCLDAKPEYLLIQFGHNDQPGKGPQRESAADGDFRTHLVRFIQEARSQQIKPILVTSLTRRRWNSDGTIQESLREYADATIAVAKKHDVPLIDLHGESIKQCEKMGPVAFRAFEPMTNQGADHTHLNSEGSIAVASLVVAKLLEIMPELTPLFNQEKLGQIRNQGETPTTLRTEHLTIDQTDETISIRTDKRTILTYNKRSPSVPEGIDPIYQRSGFLHPVKSPSGKIVTAAFPFDHPHQQGIFSAWVSTSWNEQEVDFWNLAKGTGRVLHQRVIDVFSGNNQIGFEVDLIHQMLQPHTVDILRERWRVTANHRGDDVFVFDLQSTQEAITDSPLLIQQNRYGGFAVRGPVSWLSTSESTPNDPKFSDCTIATEQTDDRTLGNHQRTRWVCMTGLIEGSPASITMMKANRKQDSSNAVRLHPSKPYFCFSRCVEESFTITKATPLVSHFRFLITDSAPNQEWILQQWEQWQREIDAVSKQNKD